MGARFFYFFTAGDGELSGEVVGVPVGVWNVVPSEDSESELGKPMFSCCGFCLLYIL